MNRLTSLTLAVLLPLLVPAPAFAGQRDVNHVVNPGFEDNSNGQAEGWSRYGEGYELVREGRDGSWCIRCRSDTGRQTLGAAQELIFDPPVQHPLLISGWSKGAGVEGGEYSVYLDVHYADGTPLWGQQALFQRGTHDWAYTESLFTPSKPVARIQTFVLFRRAKGTAWFDDIRVSLAPHRFTRATALGGFTGEGRIEALASVSLPSTWQTQVRHRERVVFTQQGEGLSQRISWNGRDADGQPVPPGTCTIRFAATDRLLGETVTWSREVDTSGAQSGRNYAVWTESSMQRVMPVDLPETTDPPVTLALSAARNEFNAVIRKGFGLVKQRYGLPTLTTAKVPQDPVVMRDLNVDWNCPVSNVYSFEDAERCRAAGFQVWSYVCCGPRAPFANFLADDPLIQARLILIATRERIARELSGSPEASSGMLTPRKAAEEKTTTSKGGARKP